MKRIILAKLITLIMSTVALGQTQGDACHVYVVDVAKAKKAFEAFRETGNAEADAKALSVGQTLFPEFRPVIGEEELTTRIYPFPSSNLVITASVFYTDESMPAESMLLGIVISNKAEANAVTAENGSVAEVAYNEHTDIVRAKQYVSVRGRSYLIGVECRCKERNKSK